MKDHEINKICINGYVFHIIKPELSALNRKKEDLKIMKNIKSSLESYKKYDNIH